VFRKGCRRALGIVRPHKQKMSSKFLISKLLERNIK
jgi:hypothetical protein